MINLSKEEALVLFEWLSSLELDGHANAPDEATQKLLWKLEGQLEKSLTAVVSPEYGQLLNDAKALLGVGS